MQKKLTQFCRSQTSCESCQVTTKFGECLSFYEATEDELDFLITHLRLLPDPVLKIKYHCQDIDKIDKLDVGDWIDLRSAEDMTLAKGEIGYISLGVSMQLPNGYEAHVAPRSSTPKKFGIMCANSFGIIDNSYCGDNDVWKFPAIAIRDTTIHKNDRICQFRLFKNQRRIPIEFVDSLDNTDRGGFGSTGTN